MRPGRCCWQPSRSRSSLRVTRLPDRGCVQFAPPVRSLLKQISTGDLAFSSCRQGGSIHPPPDGRARQRRRPPCRRPARVRTWEALARGVRAHRTVLPHEYFPCPTTTKLRFPRAIGQRCFTHPLRRGAPSVEAPGSGRRGGRRQPCQGALLARRPDRNLLGQVLEADVAVCAGVGPGLITLVNCLPAGSGS